MIRRPPRSTQSRSSAASDVYKRQGIESLGVAGVDGQAIHIDVDVRQPGGGSGPVGPAVAALEDPAPSTGVESLGVAGVDGQGPHSADKEEQLFPDADSGP